MQDTIIRQDRFTQILDMAYYTNLSSHESVMTILTDLVNSPSSDFAQLKQSIQIDPPLVAKLIRASNSNYYSQSRNKIDEIEKGMVILGNDSLKELILGQRTIDLFADEQFEGYMRNELWIFSIAVALFSKMLFRHEFGLKGEDVYTAGLLHKIGLMVEEQFMHSEFIEVLKLKNRTGKGLKEAENEIFGFDHNYLGVEIASMWGLPEKIINAIRYHSNPLLAPKEHFKIPATIYVASCACQFAELGYFGASPFDESIFRACIHGLSIEQQALSAIIDEGRLQIASMLDKGIY